MTKSNRFFQYRFLVGGKPTDRKRDDCDKEKSKGSTLRKG